MDHLSLSLDVLKERIFPCLCPDDITNVGMASRTLSKAVADYRDFDRSRRTITRRSWDTARGITMMA